MSPQGKTQNTMERLCFWDGLGAPWSGCKLEDLSVEKSLAFFTEAAALMVWDKQAQDGQMDECVDDGRMDERIN